MTREKLKAAQHAAPFRPFRVRMADGSSFHVPHPDFISVAPTGRTVVIHGHREQMSILDLWLMTEIEYDPPAVASA